MSEGLIQLHYLFLWPFFCATVSLFQISFAFLEQHTGWLCLSSGLIRTVLLSQHDFLLETDHRVHVGVESGLMCITDFCRFLPIEFEKTSRLSSVMNQSSAAEGGPSLHPKANVWKWRCGELNSHIWPDPSTGKFLHTDPSVCAPCTHHSVKMITLIY